ncbi:MULTISPECIES: GH25 family lysozyme [unclassified Paenibacillus]|uniref:GH25 family lysozyme n=1 Tax=unclassified Paenibacillus TaxID=185978 RepID=UPI000970BCB8|nr:MULTISPECIES: GH25 family lysozyme [unclassified Paenibacillus]ASS66361.1 glycoside hydrolase [Paenibacillus sp. RUD330]
MQARNNKNAQGIDVSRYQGTIDWNRVASDGISFAFLKASQGVSYRDPQFLANVQGARAAGLAIGAYHFLDAESPAEAIKEAQNLYSAITAVGGPDKFILPPVLDHESNPGKLSKAELTGVAKAFLLEIERLTGRKPILYTGNSFAGNFSAELAAYPLWVARYSTAAPADVSGWSRWTFWQYSDGKDGGTRPSGGRKVAGIAGPVDLNEYAGTPAELLAQFHPAPPAAEIVPKVVRLADNKLLAIGRIEDGKLVAPVADVLQALGIKVQWDNATKKLYV